ncbi:MAG: outer membrane protein assembly factor [Bacteroidota bacterium]|nr:outer membrane protein assembly factor [Bacteroidota bacterium]
MKKSFSNCLCCFIYLTFCSHIVVAQKSTRSDSVDAYKAIEAGPQYKRYSFYQWLMGKNYRREWTTAVKVPVMLLDTAEGGLTAYKAGGGHQTKSLHVKTASGKEYALRSVDKTLGKVLPEILHHTFLEGIVNDEVSMSHPYGAASVPLMAQKAGIYYTMPKYVYLPAQPLLDTFNKTFANHLYLFEQRLSGSWKEANNLGNFDNFIDTYQLLDKLHKDNSYLVDQNLFIRSRLFDMLIGDWDRHEDQWAWGLKEIKDKKVYEPVPQDRDQAYFKYDGKLLSFLIAAAGLKYFQAFNYTLPDVKTFNYEERNLDRFFANEMTLHDWQTTAIALQQSLTDNVIETALKQLPPEIFAIAGCETIAKLKARRSHLLEYAETYYRFISKEVDVVGSKGKEDFEVNRVSDNETSVKVFRPSKEGTDLIYSRIFKTDETKEVRLYGLSGNDSYSINGQVNRGIKIKIIGGDQQDSIIDRSSVKKARKSTEIYDDFNNNLITSKQTKLHLSGDTNIHTFNYFGYLYDKKGIGPNFSYNYDDRLFAGLTAKIIHHKWRRLPFAYEQQFALNYSISQHAISATYQGLFPKAIGKWDVFFKGNYDAIRWTKFFGFGNETALLTNYNDFYRMRSEQWEADGGINRKFAHNDITIGGFFQSIRVINDPGKFVSKNFASIQPGDFNTNNFIGTRVSYVYDNINDSVVPTKGVTFSANATYNHNLSSGGRDFTRYYGSFQFYLPLAAKLSLSIKTAATTVVGNPLFYQYASVGGPETLRGYRLERFWGKTGFYDANEVRYITNIKSYIYNGKAGLLALFDNGRVWMPGETSNTWHTAYGGGILLAPFNKILIVLTYAKSAEMKLLQLRVGRSF